jgi:hypothetical protein
MGWDGYNSHFPPIINIFSNQYIMSKLTDDEFLKWIEVNITIDNIDNPETIDELCKTNQLNLRQDNDSRFTALLYTAHNDLHQSMQHLIELGADIEKKTINKSTPLTLAAYIGSDKCTKQLLNAGAEINQPEGSETNSLLDLVISRIHWKSGNYYKVALTLIDYGITSPIAPPNIQTIIANRFNYRLLAIAFISIFKYKRTNTPNPNGRDAIRHIGKHIWSSRFNTP